MQIDWKSLCKPLDLASKERDFFSQYMCAPIGDTVLGRMKDPSIIWKYKDYPWNKKGD